MKVSTFLLGIVIGVMIMHLLKRSNKNETKPMHTKVIIHKPIDKPNNSQGKRITKTSI